MTHTHEVDPNSLFLHETIVVGYGYDGVKNGGWKWGSALFRGAGVDREMAVEFRSKDDGGAELVFRPFSDGVFPQTIHDPNDWELMARDGLCRKLVEQGPSPVKSIVNCEGPVGTEPMEWVPRDQP